jgi:tRNA(fMet)-specific endonuclease VapC
LFGVYHSIHKKRNLANIQAFFQHFSILVFCKNASHLFAEHKTLLKTNGNSLADMDLMIASIALHHEMVLVTNNIKHFNRIKKLKLENWAEK